MKDKLLTTKQAAEILAISEDTLRSWIWSGKGGVKYVKIGGAVRYKESDLHEYIARRTYIPQAPRLTVSIPSIFSELPDRTIITKKELASIIGKNVRCLYALILEGSIPRAINQKTAVRSSGLVWSLGSIRKLKADSESA